MKKHILYGGLLLSVIAFTSCDGNYEDWASPQSNSQEESAAAYSVNIAAGTDANLVMPVSNDTIKLVTLSSDNTNVKGYTLKSVKVNGTEIPASLLGNNIIVSANNLDSIIQIQNNSRANIKRDAAITSSFAVNLANGDAVALNGQTSATVKPEPIPAIDEKGYFLLGDFKGYGWVTSNPLNMTKISDGVYQALVETTNTGDNWFKFYGGSSYKDAATTWDDINATAMGCRKNGDNSTSNFVVWTGDKYGVQTPTISGVGKWVVKLDVNNMVYTISKPTLYLAGDVNGWKQATALMLNNAGKYTGYVYVNTNGFKFSSQADWNGTNYGAGATNGILSTDGGAGNLTVSENGLYYASVDVSNLSYALTQITSMSIIGSVKGNWDTDVDMTYNSADNSYSVTADLKAGVFKFRINHGWDLNLGGTTDALSQDGDNINLAADGTYTITVWPTYDGNSHFSIVAK